MWWQGHSHVGVTHVSQGHSCVGGYSRVVGGALMSGGNSCVVAGALTCGGYSHVAGALMCGGLLMCGGTGTHVWGYSCVTGALMCGGLLTCAGLLMCSGRGTHMWGLLTCHRGTHMWWLTHMCWVTHVWWQGHSCLGSYSHVAGPLTCGGYSWVVAGALTCVCVWRGGGYWCVAGALMSVGVGGLTWNMCYIYTPKCCTLTMHGSHTLLQIHLHSTADTANWTQECRSQSCTLNSKCNTKVAGGLAAQTCQFDRPCTNLAWCSTQEDQEAWNGPPRQPSLCNLQNSSQKCE